ncbi:MAG: hypothetical protein LBF28_01290 [Rickettsiales bacterium]|jgi:hypothetical protein|nr:hypothetical protein [Rickettsiales bacterium]
MRSINKILYSAFTFMACVLFPRFNSWAAVACGPIRDNGILIIDNNNNGLQTIFRCCNKPAGTGCSDNYISPNSGSYNAACFTYDGVWGLNFYNCSISEYKCDGASYYTGSGCVSCGATNCNPTAHKQTTCPNCGMGFYKDGTCKSCPGNGLTKSTCHSGAVTSCYITYDSGSDTTGDWTMSGECFYSFY